MTDQTQPSSTDLNEQSRTIWDANAEVWDSRMDDGGNSWQVKLIQPTVSNMLQVQPGERVLDIACGNGIFSRHLASLGASVVASDFSPKLIALAKERTQPDTNISYHVADATSEAELLALGEPASFDAAACNNAIMDMPEIAPLFRAVRQLLKPGGRFAFSVMHPVFNGAHITKVIELPDYDAEPTYSIKVARYLNPGLTMGLGIMNQPQQQYYWHRPLHELLNAAFEAGFVLDRLEEPPSPSEKRPSDPMSWANFDAPPLLFARLRLPR